MPYQVGNKIIAKGGESINTPYTLVDTDGTQLQDVSWVEMRIGTEPPIYQEMAFVEGETETVATLAMSGAETADIPEGTHPLQLWVTFGTANTEVMWEGELELQEGIPPESA